MTKPVEKNQPETNLNPNRILDLLGSEQGQQVAALSQEWAAEATQLIRRNPWVAVLGAAVIGYYLGSTRNRGKGSR